MYPVRTTISMVKLNPGRLQSLAHLSDKEVLEGTQRLVGRSNQLLAALLVHLAEVDARGLHRTRACTRTASTSCVFRRMRRRGERVPRSW